MPTTLRLRFDANQDFQLEAINSVVKLFDSLPRYSQAFRLSNDVVPNLPEYTDLADRWLESNLFEVRRQNGFDDWSDPLVVDSGNGLEGVCDESWRAPHFTIEMETGTGKTYVYLRTIHELRKQYGFGKFIIVVPSIAIYEGVIKNFAITRDHFRALYGNEPVNLTAYDGSQLSRLRNFATSTFTEILVITLDAFNKFSNNIYKPSEKLPGERRPYQYVQETRPILILDEPQNMESERSQQALRSLHPLLALRYSATHRSSPNLVYRLTPFEAYRRNLVKRIQVIGISERDNANEKILALQRIERKRNRLIATVRTLVKDLTGTREEEVVLRQGDNLYTKTGRDEHRAGFVVSEINLGTGYVEFENGTKLRQNEGAAPSRHETFRVQIENTIEQHMRLQSDLREKGIKVLSLFFIDRVDNYVLPEGIIRRLFDEAYERLKHDYAFFKTQRADEVREAYFARRKTKTGEEVIDTEGRNEDERKAEKAAFELIMRDKERLLSFDERTCFIFAHSALKEGWDNPNVFQICTLNQTVSEIKKRQEIGRGLRLCVDQTGERVFDEDLNVLTVVANESYGTYAANLQREYTDAGDMAPPPPTEARRNEARRNDAIFFRNDQFEEFWRKLSQRARYRLVVDTPALIAECVTRLNKATFSQPVIVVERGRFVMTQCTIRAVSITPKKVQLELTLRESDGTDKTLTQDYHAGDELWQMHSDRRLRTFGSLRIIQQDGVSKVAFSNNVVLETGEDYEYTPDTGETLRERLVLEQRAAYPVPNLIDRVVRETQLTRQTIYAIFERMSAERKKALFRNPEGFIGIFITELRNALADHVTERLTFDVSPEIEEYDLPELFPFTKRYPQKEVLEAGPHGLYDLVQKDSEVEQRFIDRLKADGKVVFYFKFPPLFKIDLPHILGNYNPDWGIARLEPNGRVTLHMIRETKGTTDLSALQFPNERRKIKCAQKYFAKLGIDYRTIKPEDANWWQPMDSYQSGLI